MLVLAGPLGNSALQYGRDAILLIACAPLAYYVVATLAAVRFFSRERKKTLDSYTPPVSVLKPVCGVDFASYENFKSFCVKDYPAYEILFCVNDLDDAAVPLIRRLAQEFPQRSIRLLSGAAQLGSNRKVNNLVLLAREAKYELLVQNDGDVRVGANYLQEMAAPFERAETGVVSCFYRGVTQENIWAEMEALGVATDFSAGVLVAVWLEGVTFALGASVATTKRWLGKIGGYEGLANVLADDYEIGNRVAKAGGRAMMSREVVETMYPSVTFGKLWQHQVRWARTVRLCRPGSYVGLLFTHGLPLAVAGAIASRSAAGAFLFMCAYVVLRLVVAGTVGVWGLRDETARQRWWLLPLRDLLQFAVWVASFFSNRIVWGNAEFELSANGEMVATGSANAKKGAEKPLRTS
ncbi:MAG TPA: bacteriohopanetetrol glucosamine biosynthesis glycosyltransferase HpnI [Candidatus Bathyarchaeia archaeon]|nr:bacteriohopanetetrol glucosamine biosynthesis glycosyltransferase HpnI [Candidatus Bathyarchaeia archaeon]